MLKSVLFLVGMVFTIYRLDWSIHVKVDSWCFLLKTCLKFFWNWHFDPSLDTALCQGRKSCIIDWFGWSSLYYPLYIFLFRQHQQTHEAAGGLLLPPSYQMKRLTNKWMSRLVQQKPIQKYGRSRDQEHTVAAAQAMSTMAKCQENHYWRKCARRSKQLRAHMRAIRDRRARTSLWATFTPYLGATFWFDYYNFGKVFTDVDHYLDAC